MILVDSSVWIDYFNGKDSREVNRLDAMLGVEPVALGDLILTEVLQGFRDDSSYQTAKNVLQELTIYQLLGTERAVRAAQCYRQLRKRGKTVRKTADVIIGSFCIDEKIPLLFSDRDFIPFVEHMKLQSVLGDA